MAHDKDLTKKQEKEVLEDVRTTIAILSCFPKNMTVKEAMEKLKKQQKEWENNK